MTLIDLARGIAAARTGAEDRLDCSKIHAQEDLRPMKMTLVWTLLTATLPC